MPNWKTHLEIGKQLREYLGYDDEQYELFKFGNILPDINNGYLLKDVSKKIEHRITHYKGDYTKFNEKYKNEINNPLIFGYFTHLYTDFNWNKNFYENRKFDYDVKENDNKLREMKQHDFRLYNKKFYKNTIEINNIDKLLKESNKIDEISITKEDILGVKKFLDMYDDYCGERKEKLLFYSEEELDSLKKDTILKLKNIIEKNTLAG